jgi:uncharacterized protein YqhQ
MEDSFKNLVIAFITIGLFGMLILTAVVQVGNDYGKDTSTIVGGSLSLDQFNHSITDVETNAQSLKSKFEEQNVWSAIAGVVVEGIFGIGLSMVGMILTPFTLITDIFVNVFHIPVFVTSVLLGILILGIIFAIWRLIKIGD